MRLSAGILVKLVIFMTLLFGLVSTEAVAAEGLARTENSAVDRAVGQEFVKAWDDLTKAGKTFSNLNPVALEKYMKLSDKTKVLVLKFGDIKDKSTFAKFLDDTDDADFLAFINKAENENLVKGFVSHKEGVDLSNITDEVAEIITEQVDNLPITDKIATWYNRSTRIAGNKSRYALARVFEDNNSKLIKNNSSPPCGKWGGNGNRKHHSQLQLLGSNKRVILDDALISPNAVAFDDLGQPIYKLIYHDSKLSSAAPWTPNQKSEIIDVFSKQNSPDFIEFEVRNGVDYFTQKYPNTFIGPNTKVRIYKDDIFKSISSGDGGAILETVKIF